MRLNASIFLHTSQKYIIHKALSCTITIHCVPRKLPGTGSVYQSTSCWCLSPCAYEPAYSNRQPLHMSLNECCTNKTNYLLIAWAPRAQAAAVRLEREILAPKPPPQRLTITSTLREREEREGGERERERERAEY